MLIINKFVRVLVIMAICPLWIFSIWSVFHQGSLSSISYYISMTMSYHLYFSVSLKFGVFYIISQWGEFTVKNAILYFYTFLFFVILHQKISVFIIFISFSDEVLNFCNRILTNQKLEQVIRNCQWSCVFGNLGHQAILKSCLFKNKQFFCSINFRTAIYGNKIYTLFSTISYALL